MKKYKQVFAAVVLGSVGWVGSQAADTNINTTGTSQPATSENVVQGQAQGITDLNISARIRDQLSATNLSATAREIKVTTRDGRVTLSGTVKSEREKRVITEIATKAVKEENVDNQLVVKEPREEPAGTR